MFASLVPTNAEKELIRQRAESARVAGRGPTFDVGSVVRIDSYFVYVKLDDGREVAAHPTGLMWLEASQKCISEGARVIVSLPDRDQPAHLWAYTREEDYRAKRSDQ